MTERAAWQPPCDKGKAAREIVSGPRNQPHAGRVPPCQNAKAVMLDFVQPTRPTGGRSAGKGAHPVAPLPCPRQKLSRKSPIESRSSSPMRATTNEVARSLGEAAKLVEKRRGREGRALEVFAQVGPTRRPTRPIIALHLRRARSAVACPNGDVCSHGLQHRYAGSHRRGCIAKTTLGVSTVVCSPFDDGFFVPARTHRMEYCSAMSACAKGSSGVRSFS